MFPRYLEVAKEKPHYYIIMGKCHHEQQAGLSHLLSPNVWPSRTEEHWRNPRESIGWLGCKLQCALPQPPLSLVLSTCKGAGGLMTWEQGSDTFVSALPPALHRPQLSGGLWSQSWQCCWFGSTEALERVANTGWPLLNRFLINSTCCLCSWCAHLKLLGICLHSPFVLSPSQWTLTGVRNLCKSQEICIPRCINVSSEELQESYFLCGRRLRERALLLLWTLKRSRFEISEKWTQGTLRERKTNKKEKQASKQKPMKQNKNTQTNSKTQKLQKPLQSLVERHCLDHKIRVYHVIN